MQLTNRVGADLPFYLQDWFTAVVLLAWIAVAAIFGYARFSRMDLA